MVIFIRKLFKELQRRWTMAKKKDFWKKSGRVLKKTGTAISKGAKATYKGAKVAGRTFDKIVDGGYSWNNDDLGYQKIQQRELRQKYRKDERKVLHTARTYNGAVKMWNAKDRGVSAGKIFKLKKGGFGFYCYY